MPKHKSSKKQRGKEVIALSRTASSIGSSSPISELLVGRATLIREGNTSVYAHGIDSHCEILELWSRLEKSDRTAYNKFQFILNLTTQKGPPLNNDTWAKVIHGAKYKGLYEFIFCKNRVFFFRLGANVVMCINHLYKDDDRTSRTHLDRALAIKESYNDIAR